ncbi:AraC family transcriptional regulator [Winogradskya consettensis]|uniref:AraC family transcriptional regulator n=2 Tax=Winogradskya consettensis TaxID=113560 RepID=A0A919SE12_9ACTN|nr:AraC family transcriptional regulator [Actinoplanes consettensis]
MRETAFSMCDTFTVMDVLSDAVATLRIGRPHSSIVRLTSDRALGAVAGAGFHVVLEGSCLVTTASIPPVPLAAGDVVFLPQGSAHGLSGADAVLLCGAYLLDRSRSHPLLDGLPPVIHLPSGSCDGLRTTVDLVGAELRGSRPGADAMLPALLDVLLLQMLRAHYSESDTGWAATLRDPAVAAVLRAIHGDVARPWTVPALAAEASLSRAALGRRFTALVGRPPLSYLTWWRMTVAAGLLTASAAPLATIARQVGYTSEFAFAAAFKRSHGRPPGVFRRESAPPGVLSP